MPPQIESLCEDLGAGCYHQLPQPGWPQPKHFFLIVLEAATPGSGASASVLGGPSSWLCPHSHVLMGLCLGARTQRGSQLSQPLLMKALIPPWGLHPHDCVTSERPITKCHHIGDRVSKCKFWGDKRSVHSTYPQSKSLLPTRPRVMGTLGDRKRPGRVQRGPRWFGEETAAVALDRAQSRGWG